MKMNELFCMWLSRGADRRRRDRGEAETITMRADGFSVEEVLISKIASAKPMSLGPKLEGGVY